MQSTEQLPRGTWTFTGPLPADTTDTELADFLNQRGIYVGPEHIQVKPRRDGQMSAIVCIPNDVVNDLLAWAINGDRLRGHAIALQAQVPKFRE